MLNDCPDAVYLSMKLKIRINELARELEVKPNIILDLLPELGVEEKKTHSSSIDEDVALAIKHKLAASSSGGSDRSEDEGGGTAVAVEEFAEEEKYERPPVQRQPVAPSARVREQEAPREAVSATEEPSTAASVKDESSAGTQASRDKDQETDTTPDENVAEQSSNLSRSRALPLRPPLAGSSRPPLAQPGQPRPSLPVRPQPQAPAPQAPQQPRAAQPQQPPREPAQPQAYSRNSAAEADTGACICSRSGTGP